MFIFPFHMHLDEVLTLKWKNPRNYDLSQRYHKTVSSYW